MDRDAVDIVRDWNDKNYLKSGARAQRSYPNEEFVRFLARHYFPLPPDRRAQTDILELGSGACGNLWMAAHEGFRAHGVDVSPEAIRLGTAVLAERRLGADLKLGLMTELPFAEGSMDAVFDVLSTAAMVCADFERCLAETRRVLKPGGRFLIYTPGAGSDAFKNFAPAIKLDDWTLNGIYRKDSPYSGCLYPQRFDTIPRLELRLKANGFRMTAAERLNRTYNGLRENFEYLSVEAQAAA